MSTEKHEYVIEGIPIGTRFRIEEVTPTDGSHLQGVSVTGGVDTQVVANTYVQGSISGSGTNVTATFTNTKHELINIDFTKTWKNAMVTCWKMACRIKFISSSNAARRKAKLGSR